MNDPAQSTSPPVAAAPAPAFATAIQAKGKRWTRRLIIAAVVIMAIGVISRLGGGGDATKPTVSVTPAVTATGDPSNPGAAEPAAPAKAKYDEAARRYDGVRTAAIQKLESNRAPSDSRSNFALAVRLLEDGDATGADRVFSDDIYLRARMKDEFNAMDRLLKEVTKLKPAADAEGQALFEKRMKDDPVFRAQIEGEAKQREQDAKVDELKAHIEAGTPLSEQDAKSNKLFAVLRDFFPGKPPADAPPHLKNKQPDIAALSSLSSEEITIVSLVWKDPGRAMFMFHDDKGIYSCTIRPTSGERSQNNMANLLRSFEMRDFGSGIKGYDRVAIGDGGGLSIEIEFDASQNDMIGKVFTNTKGCESMLIEVSGKFEVAHIGLYNWIECSGKSVTMRRAIVVKKGEVVCDEKFTPK